VHVHALTRGAPPAVTASKIAVSGEFGAPVLDLKWFFDGASILAAGCSQKLTRFDLQTGQKVDVGSHDAPIKSVHM